MNRLLILDGNALLHRAYHALPPLRTPDGQPSGAVYGFISMMIRLQLDLSATHFAVAFDRPKPTFRNELYKEYQAQRPPLEDDLLSQIAMVHEVLQEMNISVYEMDGYEADDIIGTLVDQFIQGKLKTIKNHIDQIIIVTGDRDILQLVVDEKVLVYMPVKGLSEAKLYGEKEVVDRLMVTPTQIPEWKGLCGDPSDNYPGVKGIGPKTASDLVTRYKTIEGVYTAVEAHDLHISEGVRTKLLQDKDNAFLSKNLATIRKDAPITVHADNLIIETFNTEQTRSMLLKLGFPSLVKRLNNNAKTQQASEVQEEHNKKKDDQLNLFT